MEATCLSDGKQELTALTIYNLQLIYCYNNNY